MLTPTAFYAAIDGTWPAASFHKVGRWLLREGQGGGQRVSAATPSGEVTLGDVQAAEDAMCQMNQQRLFMIRDSDQELDVVLAAQNYQIVDPVNGYYSPVSALTDIPIPRVTAFAIWEPLAIMEEIWAKGGVGPGRLDVMARAKVKTGILARWNEKPAGTAFAAIHDGVAMVHAVEVLPHQRRQGVAGWIMRRAAFWAQANGAHTLAVLCVEENTAANALYQRLGFRKLCGYHYRKHSEDI